uniref:F-box domain-containing protein n=1 Tax=Anopheles epiroticus TaxID=199890 RepID=A0A182PIU4_9DIPT
MDSDEGENNSMEMVCDLPQRSRSSLETVAEEEVEGYQPILVTPTTEWKSIPLLVEHSTRQLLAPSLEIALNKFFRYVTDVTEIRRSDLMIVLIYLIAFETGLVPKGSPLPPSCLLGKHHPYRSFDRRLVYHFASRLPFDWFRNRSGVFQLELELVHDSATNLSGTLVVFCSGDLLIVNLLPTCSEKTAFCTAIPISFYVPTTNAAQLPLLFQDLPRLAKKLKDELFIPFRNHMYASFVSSVHPSIRGLPPEIIHRIVNLLNDNSRRNLVKALDPDR